MKILLVDGTNIAIRYAFAQLKDLQIEHPEESVSGVLRSVEIGIRDCAAFAGCSHCIVAFDSDGPTWRREKFPSYKAGRKRIEFGWSVRCSAYLTERGWLCIANEGFEADDILATLAARVVDKGFTACILSGDSDLLQTMGPNCHVYQFGSHGEPRFCRRDEGYILQKFGIINASQLAMYKALAGEAGDTLPGVPKIGRVKATALVRAYENPAAMRKLGALRPDEQEAFDLMYQLVQLREDVPLEQIKPKSCEVPKL